MKESMSTFLRANTLEFLPPVMGIAGGLFLQASLDERNRSWDNSQRIIGGVLIVVAIGLFIHLVRNGTIERLGINKLVGIVAIGALCVTISDEGELLEIVGMNAAIFGGLALLFGFNKNKDADSTRTDEPDEHAVNDAQG